MSRNPTRRLATVFIFACLVSVTSAAYAQSTNASVSERVTDPSGALVVGADLAAIRIETNVRYATTTNSVGEYVLSNLPPGTYRIEVQKPAFKKTLKPDVRATFRSSIPVHLAD